MQQNIFVFGTLTNGFPKFHYNQARQIDASFATAQPYPFYLVGPRYMPWLIEDPGQGLIVQGEVYQADNKQLLLMDQLEQVGEPGGYQRRLITVKNLDSGKLLKVFAYLKQPAQLNPALIKLGPLSNYLPEHAELYRTRSRQFS